MDRALRVLNRWVADGVLGRYAIGGAIGATFYAEPVLTFHLDIVVDQPVGPGGARVQSPLHASPPGLDNTVEPGCVLVGGIAVRPVPASSPLLVEALRDSVEIEYLSVPTRVLRMEHLVAIAVDAGGDFDLLCARHLVSHPSLDSAYLDAIIGRHGLEEVWPQWIQ